MHQPGLHTEVLTCTSCQHAHLQQTAATLKSILSKSFVSSHEIIWACLLYWREGGKDSLAPSVGCTADSCLLYWRKETALLAASGCRNESCLLYCRDGGDLAAASGCLANSCLLGERVGGEDGAAGCLVDACLLY